MNGANKELMAKPWGKLFQGLFRKEDRKENKDGMWEVKGKKREVELEGESQQMLPSINEVRMARKQTAHQIISKM